MLSLCKFTYNAGLFIMTLDRFVKGSVNELRKEVPINGELDDTAIEDAVCGSNLSEIWCLNMRNGSYRPLERHTRRNIERRKKEI
jgi:hypothetical protein